MIQFFCVWNFISNCYSLFILFAIWYTVYMLLSQICLQAAQQWLIFHFHDNAPHYCVVTNGSADLCSAYPVSISLIFPFQAI